MFKRLAVFVIASLLVSMQGAPAQTTEVERLIAAMLANTPLTEDLRQLCDEIGGRPSGSTANLKSVDWGVQKFKDAGVNAWKESFQAPRFWLERSSDATVIGDVTFDVNVVAMTFSTGTPKAGLTAPIVAVGHGTEEDFKRLGSATKGAWVLAETDELKDIDGLFKEYAEAVGTEARAFAAGAVGVVYMSSRPMGLLYQHNASQGPDNKHPMLVMDREQAMRIVRLLKSGKKLSLNVRIDVDDRGSFESYNVIAEIPGTDKKDEIVLMGAHLDSWGLGTGGNDNGCNVAMMIDIARQLKRLGIRPKRTIRFALWNVEEHGMIGSWQYCVKRANELDNHVVAGSIDIGSGRISGFFTNGRAELLPAVEKTLQPVAGLGPFEHHNVPIVGTDNYDFMVQGVANLVGNHDPYNYGPNYHAESDTYDKVDLRQLRVNAAVVSALIYGFANMDVTWKRQTKEEVQRLIDTTPLRQQMDMFNLYPVWENGTRGRK
jgi:hypothetical protein